MNDLLDEFKTLLEGAMSGSITTFYKGEVKLVPQSYLPALMVMPVSTNVIARTTASDQFQYTVKVRIVTDIKKSLDEAGTGAIIKSQQSIIDMFEERTNTVPDADTVLGVLRKVTNIRGVNYIYNNDITIDYGGIVEADGWFYVTAEATLSFTTDLILRQS